jgi:hypothetical protein
LPIPYHPTASGISSYEEAGQLRFMSHFVFALRTDSRRLLRAITVRFSFLAIKFLSVFGFSNVRSCASSSGVQGRPRGRGPSFISSSASA